MSDVEKGGESPSLGHAWCAGRKIVVLVQTREAREILFSVMAVLTIVVLGTGGYCLIEGWNWLEGLYMTVTTLTTIGYGEVHPLSPAGRVFTIALIVVGVGTVGILSLIHI